MITNIISENTIFIKFIMSCKACKIENALSVFYFKKKSNICFIKNTLEIVFLPEEEEENQRIG